MNTSFIEYLLYQNQKLVIIHNQMDGKLIPELVKQPIFVIPQLVKLEELLLRCTTASWDIQHNVVCKLKLGKFHMANAHLSELHNVVCGHLYF